MLAIIGALMNPAATRRDRIPEFLESLIQQSVKLTLSDGESKTCELTVMSPKL